MANLSDEDRAAYRKTIESFTDPEVVQLIKDKETELRATIPPLSEDDILIQLFMLTGSIKLWREHPEAFPALTGKRDTRDEGNNPKSTIEGGFVK